MLYQNAIELSHEYMERCIKPGDTVIDATAGNGKRHRFRETVSFVLDKGIKVAAAIE